MQHCLPHIQDFLLLGIDDDLVTIAVIDTNQYARDEDTVGWGDTNNDKMSIFLIIIPLQMITKKPSHQMYWIKLATLMF